MSATALNPKPRARRIAADEAHSWARNLRLRNPYAKLVLCMTTLYVNGDGTCYVGIGELAKDCELAQETVRRRLSWLETVGAITRMPQWLDENGRRNGEGRGKRTTDEIRLMIGADADEIEARASGDTDVDADGETDAVSPVHGRGLSEATPTSSPVHGGGLTDDEKGVSPPVSPLAAPSLRTGADSSEPEPEGIPPPPLRGEGDDQSDHEAEGRDWQHLETWKRFETAWQEPILHQRMCRQIWSAFTDIERETAIKVARGYVKWRTAQRRPPNACNAQKILREREAWSRFAEMAGPDPALRVFIAEDSPEYAALRVAGAITGVLPPLVQFDPERGVRGHWWKRGSLPADLMGLVVFADKHADEFTSLEMETPPAKAWAARINHWIGFWPKTLRVPCLWPPRKDGSFADQSAATNDDEQQNRKTG